MHNEDVTEERRKREDEMTAKIDATEVIGRYKRHNAHYAQADKEVAKSKAKSNSKVVARHKQQQGNARVNRH